MSVTTVLHRAMFVAFAVAGVFLIGVAHREEASRAAELSGAPAVREAEVFGGLEACEVPGLHERLLARGPSTLAYSGEFASTRLTPWTQGQSRIFLYVVTGKGVVRIGDAVATAGAGDFFVIPKGVQHAVSPAFGVLRAIYIEDKT